MGGDPLMSDEVQKLFVCVPKGAVLVGLHGECPCGEGRIASLNYGTRQIGHEDGRKHRMPEVTYTVAVQVR
jgi:hypothetical protein